LALPFYPVQKGEGNSNYDATQNAKKDNNGERCLKLPYKKGNGDWGRILHRKYRNDQNNENSDYDVNHG